MNKYTYDTLINRVITDLETVRSFPDLFKIVDDLKRERTERQEQIADAQDGFKWLSCG